MSILDELWTDRHSGYGTQIQSESGQYVITSGANWLRDYIIKLHNQKVKLDRIEKYTKELEETKEN